MKRTAILLLTVFALVAAACGSTATTTSTTATTAAPATSTTDAMKPEMADVVGVATEAGNFSTLLTAVEAAGLVDTLQGDGPFTVFVPTDEAFAALPAGTLEALLADTEALSDVLLYHVVSGEVLASDVIGLDSATTVQGEDIAITVEGESVKVNEANVVTTDIAASNGVIHIIDQVILPPSMSAAAEMGDIVQTAQAAGGFTTLLAAVEAAGLVETLKGDGPFTVFAPTDEAFADLPAGTLEALVGRHRRPDSDPPLPRGSGAGDCRPGDRTGVSPNRRRLCDHDPSRGRQGVHKRRRGRHHRHPHVQRGNPRHRSGDPSCLIASPPGRKAEGRTRFRPGPTLPTNSKYG